MLPDVAHTSLLRRTISTADLVLNIMGRDWIPVHRTWRLNERHYGALTGLTKREVRDRTDEATYTAWRRSWSTAPPPAAPGDLSPGNDARYAGLPPDARVHHEAAPCGSWVSATARPVVITSRIRHHQALPPDVRQSRRPYRPCTRRTRRRRA
ncbi:2,3-bisphosphoglycerate-dependent phosphoglycerate mutase [Streptomyces sp. NPDC087894]|uniref:2,3-bisphosphoglycerate-dependent phosphoglycerate mutase n=1 Tax=Streptomyces sp. NPDC087894 TaxID=3365816 RepID=UPI0037F2E855